MASAVLNVLNDPHSHVIFTPSRKATRGQKDTLGNLKWHQKPTIRQTSLTLCLSWMEKSKDTVLNRSNSQEVCSQNKMLNSKAGKDMEVIT